MVKSQTQAGVVIFNALARADMVDIGTYGLTFTDLLHWLHVSVVNVARRHFAVEKENYYDTRPTIGRTNGKFGTGGLSTYTQATKRLSITMDPVANDADIGKLVTFFDGGSSPASFHAGIITDFISGSPTQYEVTLFLPVPDLAQVQNVTVGDWLMNGVTLHLLGENQVFSPENMKLRDITNNILIPVTEFNDYEFMTTQDAFDADGDKCYARYRKNIIDVFVPTGALSPGTLMLSAYYLPTKASDFEIELSVDETRVPEVEEDFLRRMLSLKMKQPSMQDTTVEELQTTALDDPKAKDDKSKGR